MGGKGSGCHKYLLAKRPLEDYKRITVGMFTRHNALVPGNSFAWDILGRRGPIKSYIRFEVLEDCLSLRYRIRCLNGSSHDEHCDISLERTPCQFGGQRIWFLCPGESCGRRVSVLYGTNHFACRKCHSLLYSSQNDRSDYDRTTRRLKKIRQRLGWEGGFLCGKGLRPKGMHKTTFARLKEEYDRLAPSHIAECLHRTDVLQAEFEGDMKHIEELKQLYADNQSKWAWLDGKINGKHD